MKKFAARVGNIYFLSHIGPSLRWATEDTARDELPTNVKELLARLEQLEDQLSQADGRRCSLPIVRFRDFLVIEQPC
jgi:hypothetical protein